MPLQRCHQTDTAKQALFPGFFGPFLCDFSKKCCTLPTADILSGINARAFLVCEFLMKNLYYKNLSENMKKIVGAIWKLPAK